MLAGIACAALIALGLAAPPAPAAAVRAPEEVTVGTFNIRYANDGDGANAWRHRRAMVADILGNGDFWGLQEVLPTQLEEVLASSPRFAAISRTREVDPAKGEACPILYDRARWEADAPEQGTFNGWNERFGDTRIDFVFASRAITVRAATIDLRKPDGRWPSDHAPALARIAWETGPRSTRRSDREGSPDPAR